MAILALDQGTTSSRAIVFAASGRALAVAQREFRQHYPHPGWVEHDAEEIWATQSAVMREAIDQAHVDIAAIGIANQRETTVVWDRDSGKPIANAIVWQDRRTAAFCDELRREHAELFRVRTGLLIDAYFSATKLRWLLDHVDGARAKAEAGKLAFGTIDCWLLWNLTGGRAHLTDVTNASRTMLFDIRKQQWDDELLALLRIPKSLLPEVRSSSEIYARTSDGIPIAAIAGDQQAALFGQRCTRPGMVKNTYGTGSFVVMNTGAEAVDSKHGLLSTIAWKIGSDATQYALEGSIFVTGAAVQWLRDELRIINTAAESETLAASVPDSNGVVVVPAFTGLGTPHWDAYARGAILGITRGTSAAHIVRATLESIALQTVDVLDAMQRDSGIALRELRVDGGATTNDLLMQMQADLANIPVIRTATKEATALGVAELARCAMEDRQSCLSEETGQAGLPVLHRYEPAMASDRRDALIARWRRGVERAQHWATE